MKKRSRLILCLALVLLMAFSIPAAAADIPLSDSGRIHWNAPGNSAVITGDGNLDIVRVDFVHYAKSSNPASVKKTSVGYILMGVKWLWQEGYAINLSNAPASVASGAEAAIRTSSLTWDLATGCSKTTGLELFSTAATTLNDSAIYGVYDGVNAVEFGPYGSSNVIAVTSVWYSRSIKAIYEFDMLFNTNFAWSTDGASNAMDLQNIATHEFGHAVGLSDVYDAVYNDQTMYGYASNGEVDKQTLEVWDLAGLHKMYGD